jgi:hypothetical protein
MTSPRSVTVHGYWLDASTKFDYAVTGVSIALVAYVGAQTETVRFGFTAGGFEAAAILLLLGSAMAGFKRLETNIETLRLNAEMLRHSERAGESMAALSQGGGMFVSESGELVDAATLNRRAELGRQVAAAAEGALDRAATSSKRWYRMRNWLLWLGLGALATSRVLPSYLSAG